MAQSSVSKRPNIILILADDMGFSDIGCFGSEIATPNLDSLAAGGVRFTQTYNYARCCPSRAALLTGLHPHQAGVGHMVEGVPSPGRPTPAYQGYLNDRCVTVAEALKGAGYHTMMSGKWHVGGVYPRNDPTGWGVGDPKRPLPPDRGFDEWYRHTGGRGELLQPQAALSEPHR